MKRQCGNKTSRNKNWTEKDSNKKINAKPDNKAEDHKKEKLITSQESSLCVHVCVCRLFTKKENNNNNKMYIYYYIMDRKRMKTDFFFCACVLCLKFKMGVKCNCTVSRQKEKRIRKQNLQGGRIVMPMFPFFFFFPFTLHKWPWTKGSPKDTLPRRTPGKLWTTTANKFTKQQIYTQTQWITKRTHNNWGSSTFIFQEANQS